MTNKKLAKIISQSIVIVIMCICAIILAVYGIEYLAGNPNVANAFRTIIEFLILVDCTVIALNSYKK